MHFHSHDSPVFNVIWLFEISLFAVLHMFTGKAEVNDFTVLVFTGNDNLF